ncbi:MAG: metal-dependent hydrolase [Haloferacaceae archaeon]
MPSTLVHVALGGLVGTALLADEFDARAVAVVLVAAALPDLDSFTALVLAGSHRALLHNLLLPALVTGALAYDTREWRLQNRLAGSHRSLRPGRLRRRLGDRGVVLAWAALAAFVAGGVLPDLFTNGVNVFYPLHDAFYTVDGKLLLSNQRGIVQTFVDLSPPRPAPSTKDVYYVTGVDPSPGAEPEHVERVFPLARGGWQLMLILVSAGVVSARLWVERRR